MIQSRRFAKPNYSFFRPPFCPNSRCGFHKQATEGAFRPAGTYLRASDQRRFPRFRCTGCGRRFSTRAFAPTYWLRKRDLFSKIADLSANGAGLRQTARVLGVSHATVARHLARAGRHCLLFLQRQLLDFRIQEPVVIDGFETFEHSQFFPFHLNLAVGADSWFLYFFTESPLRRKGRMTPAQKARRQHLESQWGRPDPTAVETGIAQLVAYLASKCNRPAASADLGKGTDRQTLTLRSDEHPAYPRALRRVRRARPQLKILHQRTLSVEARTFENPLFPVNLTDLLLRHSHAGHRRETIAFAKRRQAAVERLAVFAVWRNWIKRRRENGDPQETAATTLGLAHRRMEWKDVFRRRLFPSRVKIPRPWRTYYEGKILTCTAWVEAEGASTPIRGLSHQVDTKERRSMTFSDPQPNEFAV